MELATLKFGGPRFLAALCRRSKCRIRSERNRDVIGINHLLPYLSTQIEKAYHRLTDDQNRDPARARYDKCREDRGHCLDSVNAELAAPTTRWRPYGDLDILA